MTNEEKAQEIARGCFSKRTVDSPVNKLDQVIIKDACLKAMGWKEEQMIEKSVKWLGSIMGQISPEDPHLVCINYTDFDEFVNDFKKYMEDK